MNALALNFPSESSHQAVDVVIGEAMLDFVVADCQEWALHNNPANLGERINIHNGGVMERKAHIKQDRLEMGTRHSKMKNSEASGRRKRWNPFPMQSISDRA